MSSTTESQIKYAGDGVQVLFTFPFTYLQSTDIYVSLYNQTERRWDDTTEWTFANATTIQFTTAPPTATGDVTDNIRIQRRTSVDPLVAQFNPGSAIRASDLNDDFEQLQLAVIDNSSLVTNIDVGVTSVNDQTGAVSLDINDLTDVDTSSPGHVPTDGQALVWDAGMSHWMPGTVSSSSDGIPEAPEDNKVYGRENATWVVVADGETGPVLSVNHQTGAVKIGVEELEDFAYYPASEQVTLLGPCVGDAGTFSGTEYTSGNGPNGLYFVFPKTNTQVYDILSELTAGDAVTVCFYSSVGTVYTELETTFTNLANNGGTVPSWLVQFGDSVPGAVIGAYPAVFKSSFITNGQAPITTGQALIYDQTTEKWRPEDIAAELNISALPTLP
jgi:hypothetical protein